MNKLTVKEMTTQLSCPAGRQRFASILGEREGDLARADLISNIQRNPIIAECSMESLVAATLQAHSVKLSFITGDAVLVPFYNSKKGVKEAQYQPTWTGFYQLAMRSNQYKNLNVTDIREGELKKYDRLSGEYEIEWVEDEDEREKLPVTHYIAYYELVNGCKKTILWSRKKMENFGKEYSKTYDSASGWWKKDFNAMAYKTMYKQLIKKYGPKSIEMQAALDTDQAVLRVDKDDNIVVDSWIDNPHADVNTGEIITEATEVVEQAPQEPYANNKQVDYLLKTLNEKGIDKVNFLREKHNIDNVNKIPLSKCKDMLRELGVMINE